MLILCWWHSIKQARQHLPLARQVAVNPAHRINNAIVFTAQDHIRVFAHQLADQVLFAGHSHFIGRVQLNRQHALNRRLHNGRNLRALHMLTQQHAKHRRRRRILSCSIDEMHARRTGGNRDQQTFCAALSSRLQHDLIAVGLINLFHAAARQHFI